MNGRPRLTEAQHRGLALLAQPGAVAVTCRSTIFWRVLVGGNQIGRIHAGSLLALRNAGLVAMDLTRYDQDGPMQWITGKGRAFLADREEPHPYDRACRNLQHSGCTCMHIIDGRWCGKPRYHPIHTAVQQEGERDAE